MDNHFGVSSKNHLIIDPEGFPCVFVFSKSVIVLHSYFNV